MNGEPVTWRVVIFQRVSKLGFEVVRARKGTFVDGHEREDVVEYRNLFLQKMASLGFLNSKNAPTEQAKLALPADIE